ncbi:protein lingerer-like isoform X2 [Halichondria panicea]|uniref:protein lingerer-like isoform X2 n=1 Tax=Halichondria panicea TaxID=6063 RepID=UPI00312B39C2
MVAGMSVKSGEPQGGNTSSANRKIPTQTKTKAPVEALQMARILDDSRYPADLSDKIRSVLAIVPHRSEEEICIALHDTDFDPEKAISVLLDNDNHSSTGWTTSGGGRKGKKKSTLNDGIDLIVAPGDTRTQGKRKQGGTNRAAPTGTREGYGGGVSVGRGRGTSGRGRSNSAPRRDTGKRKTPTTSSSTSGSTSTVNDRRRAPKGERQARHSTKISPPTPAATGDELLWDTLPVENNRGQEVRGQEVRVDAEEWPPSWEQANKPGVYWEDTPTLQDEGAAPDTPPVFPEAIPTSQQQPPPLSTLSEVTPTLAIADRDSTHPQSREGGRDDDSKRRKARRIARSQIPTKPVEMPGGESLDLQFGRLGIDFGGSEQQQHQHPPTAVPTNYPSHSTAVPTNYPSHSTAVPTSYESLLTYSEVHRLAEDPSVICVSSSTSTGQYRHSEQSQVDTPATSLEGPPGLKHPSSHDRSLESHDQLLMSSQDRSGESHDLSLESHDQRLPLSAPLSPQKENIEASTSEAASVLPEPIEMPSQQITSTTTGYSGSELLMSTAPAPTVTPSTTHSTAAGGKPVPPNMMYPHLMHQYPAAFMPMYPTAAGNYGDDLSRYQASVSLAAYYQSGGADPALSAAGGTPRDMYTAGGVGGDKFGRGGSEVSVTMSQSSVGQATQGVAGSGGMQPAFMNYPNMYPSSMFYPMYFSPAAAAHSMPPKPTTAGTSFPGSGSSYQGQGGGANYNYEELSSSHEYSKMYPGVGSKSTNLPKTTAGEMGLGYKQQPHYDNKGPGTSNYQQQQQQSFGAQQQQQYMQYMQAVPGGMPLPPMPVMPGGGESGRKHTSKTAGYQSNNSFWGGQSS